MGFLKVLSDASVDASAVAASIRRQKFATGDAIIEQGEMNRNIFLPANGLIKLVYRRPSGVEYTKGFIEPGEVFASLTSTLTDRPSRFSAICLTHVDLEVMPARVFGELSKNDPAMLAFSDQMFRNLALRNEEREYDFLCLSAEERYEKFLTRSPRIAEQLTQIEIAAYLGITAVALSRIRRRRAYAETQN